MSAPKESNKKPIPRFETEDQEHDFWAEHDTVDFFDWDKAAKGRFPSLKPSTETISLRLPLSMLEELKMLANERDVPYQSLLKVYLAERIARERQEKNISRVAERRK
ncbi:MAG: BrnA antitoxin family protein [Gemmatimonadota bacterium]|nr:BrnA antitoxin family protein [Gemmatimonadota bacterium]